MFLKNRRTHRSSLLPRSHPPRVGDDRNRGADRSARGTKLNFLEAVACRLLACVVLSAPGMSLRWSFTAVHDKSLLNDAAAVVLENYLILSARDRAGLLRSSATSSAARVVLFLLWFVATLGDYTYQVMTGGMIPSVVDVQVGLKMPRIAMSLPASDGSAFSISIITVMTGPAILLWFERKRNGKFSFRQPNLSFLDSSPVLLCCLLLLAHLHGSLSAWAPVSNLIASIVASVLFPPAITKSSYTTRVGAEINNNGWQKSSLLNLNVSSLSDMTGHLRPNIIIIVHESMSGSALESSSGRKAAPFWHGQMRSSSDVYQFNNVLAGSGMTSIATSAILTGMIPYDDDGLNTIQSSLTMATELKGAGYDTACFSSYGTNFGGTYWAILDELLNQNFDVVYGPKEMGEAIVNQGGIDDRRSVGHFKEWVRNGGSGRNGSNDKPFFALLVFNNNHYPHLPHETYKYTGEDTKATERYFSSLQTADEAIEAIFAFLGGSVDDDRNHGDTIRNKTRRDNMLANTIIMGAGDHGETPGNHIRLGALNAPILQVPMYMHIPQTLITPKIIDNLSMNSERTTSTLDLIPTLRSVLRFPFEYTTEQTEKCLIGRSLANSVVPADRVVVAWQGPPLLISSRIAAFATSSEILINSARKGVSISDRAVSKTNPFVQQHAQVDISELDIRHKEMFFSQLSTWMDHPFLNATQGLKEAFGLKSHIDYSWTHYRWKDLGLEKKDLLESMGYSAYLWDGDEFSPTELLRRGWANFTAEQQSALIAFGYYSSSWENPGLRMYDPWTDKYWDDLGKNIREVLKSLGYTRTSWDAREPPAVLSQRDWDSFNCKEQWALVSIALLKEKWEANKPHCIFDDSFYKKMAEE